jgi:hypothetical protein
VYKAISGHVDEKALVPDPKLNQDCTKGRDSTSDLESGTLLGELAHVVPLVEVGGRSYVDDDIDLLAIACRMGACRPRLGWMMSPAMATTFSKN